MDNLFGHIASSGFSQQSVKLVWEREGGDGASELVGCSPCGASSVPSSWHGTASTGLLPGQTGHVSLSATSQWNKTGDFQSEQEVAF